METKPHPPLSSKQLRAGACAALIAVALAVAVLWFRGGGRADWSSQQRDGLRVQVQSELPQAAQAQQGCMVDYVTGHFSSEHWAALVQQYSVQEHFSGDAVLTFATMSGCASK